MDIITSQGTININTPHYGYIVEHHWSLVRSKGNNFIKVWDNGQGYDYRILTGIKHWFTQAEWASVIDAFYSGTGARDATFTLDLGETPTGFYPAGPDNGDVGEFTLRLIEHDNESMKLSPFKYYAPDFKFLIVSTPEYTPSAAISEGNITINSRSNGIRYPQDGFITKHEYTNNKVITKSGAMYQVDLSTRADSDYSEAVFDMSTNNAAQLLSDVIISRGGVITVNTPFADDMFGGLYQTTSHAVRCVNDVIEIRHERHNNFSLALKFWRVS